MSLNPTDSTIGGAGTVTPKAQATVRAEDAVFRATITITRAATGAVETYELFGVPADDQHEE